ncbi:MAG: serine/threonine protein kinase, partial [Planctomycetes bacterium]|nr:serine/threonine protein kinase [Planctomycetota bacterium]
MDVSQLAQDEPERTPGGTIIENRIDQTVELPDDADGEGTVPDRAIGSTLDSTDLEQHLGHTWQGTIGDDATPNTSLKAELGETKGKSKLVVQQREFCQPDEPHLGQSDYDLIKLLGEGGMGMVYSARQASIDRTVAVKMLKPKTASDETQRNKFLAEAVVTGDLEHPNIVPIYDLGKNNQGSLFYAMKRVQGTPWDEVIAEKSLPENIEIFMKVADAVGFAHSRMIIHRDLKPENVMLGSYGEVLVMD